MLRQISLLFVSFVAAGALFAQGRLMQKAPVIMREPNIAPTNINTPNTNVKSTTANWVLVDSMGNSFGTAIGILNPLAYEPYSNIAAIVHRSLTSLGGSGKLYYNISTNKGVTWTRVTNGINSSLQLSARYPSMAISNPMKISNIADATGAFAWPNLSAGGSGFDLIGIAADAPIGMGAPSATLIDHDGAYGSSSPIWAAQDNDKIFWVSLYTTPPENHPLWQARLFSTSDFANIDSLVPYAFQDSTMGGMILFGGVSKGNNVYIAGVASGVDNFAVPMVSGWCPVIMKSTDKGLTWTNWEAIDFRAIPALSAYDRLYDFKKGDTFVSYGGDVNIDKDGKVHIVTTLTDTTIDNNTGNNAIVEIFQTATGWNGKVIFAGMNDRLFTWCEGVDPGIGQMGPSPYMAVSKAGDVFACQWVNGTSINDTIADIFISTRTLTGNWSTPLNITQTPAMNENNTHFAPYLEGNFPPYTAFSNFSYEKGNTTPVVTQTNITNLYCAAVTLPVQTTQICRDIPLLAGWNMVGVPVLASDMSAGTIFPNATSAVYGYLTGYNTITTLTNGKGYWVRYLSPATVNVCGTAVTPRTVPLLAGWNMIAVYDYDVPVSALTTTPAGIINSQYYGFNNGYSIPTTLLVGKGYWVRATQAGTLNLPDTFSKSEPAATTSIIDSKWSSLRISDAAGNAQNLYFAADAKDLSRYELPPVPPTGIFDARFASNGNVEGISAAQQIMISSAEYPITVKAEKASFVIRDAATYGKVLNVQLAAGQSAVINTPVSMIEAEAVQMPVEFALEQNYPNPFNPSTTFRFSLPAKANVTLVVFNQLGEKVAEVMSNELEAGAHHINWSAEKLSSGIYFYELRAGDCRAVKKFTLLK